MIFNKLGGGGGGQIHSISKIAGVVILLFVLILGGSLLINATKVSAVTPITVSITASPASMVLPASSSVLMWTTTGTPDSCTASNFWSGAKDPTGGSEQRTGMTAGAYNFVITCSKAGVADATANVVVVVNTPSTISVSLSASPDTVTSPTNWTTLSWTTNGNPDTCTASGAWSGGKSTLVGSEKVTLPGTSATYTYTITCNKVGSASASASVNVVVNSPLQVTLGASRTTMTLPTDSTRLSWTTLGNPDSCSGSNYWTGPKTPTGGYEDRTGMTAGTYTFVITCTKGSQSATASVTVTVSPAGAIGVSISALPTTVNLPSNSTTLTWSTSGTPDSCTASNAWSGGKQAAGGSETKTGLTAGTYVFVITCSKAGASNATANVTVIVKNPDPISVSISATPSTMTLPENATTVAWSTTGTPDSCSASDSWTGIKSQNGGSETKTGLQPGTYKYTITCSKAGQSDVTAYVLVVVNPASAISVSITASPTSMTLPTNSTTLTWTTTGTPDSCNASGSWSGSKTPTGGVEPRTGMTAGGFEFKITCVKGTYSTQASVIVTVNQASTMTLNFTASPTKVLPPADSTTLTWSTTGNPDTCGGSNGSMYDYTSWPGSKNTTGGSQTISGLLPSSSHKYILRCQKAGTGDVTGTVQVDVDPYPITVTLTASSSDMTLPSNTSTLRWTTTGNPNSCLASNSWGGYKASGGGTEVVTLPGSGTYNFVITCDKGGSTVTATAYVIVRQAGTQVPLSVSISANPTNVVLPASSSVLSWTTTGNPDSCTASNFWSGAKTPTGGSETRTGLAQGSYNYVITCKKAGSFDVSANVTVVVSQAATSAGKCHFVADCEDFNACTFDTCPGVTSSDPNQAGYWGTCSHTNDSTCSAAPTCGYSGCTFNPPPLTGSCPNGMISGCFYLTGGVNKNPEYSYACVNYQCTVTRNADYDCPVCTDNIATCQSDNRCHYSLTNNNNNNNNNNGPTLPPLVTMSANPTVGANPLSTTITWTASTDPSRAASWCRATGGTYDWGMGEYGRYTNSKTGEVFGPVSLDAQTYFQIMCGNNVGANLADVTVTPATTAYTLTTYKNYGGSIQASDLTISCGTNCFHEYAWNTAVTLRAIPDSVLWKFSGWSGSCSGTNPVCNLIINATKTATATFAPRPLDYREF